MATWTFTLTFQRPIEDDQPTMRLDVRNEAGCGDAFVGISRLGNVVLKFPKQSSSEDYALFASAALIHNARQLTQLLRELNAIEVQGVSGWARAPPIWRLSRTDMATWPVLNRHIV